MVEWRFWRSKGSDDFFGPMPVLPTPEEAADDGEAMVVQSALMSLKNQILIHAIKDNENFDKNYFVDTAKSIVSALLTESRKSAERLKAEIKRAQKLRGKGRYSEDYRRGDLENLQVRRDSLQLVTERLAEHAEDLDWIHELIMKAHRMAWAEISHEMELSLDRTEKMEFGSKNYAHVRDERVQAFVENELAELIAQSTTHE